MTDEEAVQLAKGWIAYWYDPKNEETWELWNRTSERLNDLVDNNPEEAWKVVLAINTLDRSNKIQEVLSAGPVEDLLWKHGESMIATIEVQARRDPSLAKLLGGVWKTQMKEEVWQRLQKVWDRRGWDGIPGG